MARRVQCVAQPHELFAAAAESFARISEEAVARDGRMTVVLAGGSTPRALYQLLASEPYRTRISWDQVLVFWGDERHVPPDHDESNYRMAHESLLSRVAISSSQIHRIQGELPEAAAAAARYQEELVRVLAPASGAAPCFDLILLGMGPDGHTASLFPGTEAVHETQAWVVAPWVEKFQTHRITLSPVVVNQARHVVFLVSGADKAETLAAVLEGPPKPDVYPSQVVNPTSGDVTWLVDEAAARLLQRRG